MPEDADRAFEIVSRLRMEVGGRPIMPAGDAGEERRLEGIVHAPGCISARSGPRVASIHRPDGEKWVIDYDEQSPYHAFAGRRVVAAGAPCDPPLQHALRVTGHFRVSTMRLVEATADAWLAEVGARYPLSGRFEPAEGDGEGAPLSFVDEDGNTYRVVNNPAGARAGGLVQILAYPVQMAPGLSQPPQPSLWVIGPWSYADLWELRGRADFGLPKGVYVDAETGLVRRG